MRWERRSILFFLLYGGTIAAVALGILLVREGSGGSELTVQSPETATPGPSKPSFAPPGLADGSLLDRFGTPDSGGGATSNAIPQVSSVQGAGSVSPARTVGSTPTPIGETGSSDGPLAFSRETSPPRTASAALAPTHVRQKDGQARSFRDRVEIPASVGSDPVAKAEYFFQEFGELFGIQDVEQELSVVEVRQTSEGKEIVTFDRTVQGRRVFGASARVHINSDNQVIYASAAFPPDLDVPLTPKVGSQESRQHVVDALLARGYTDVRVRGTDLVIFSEGLLSGKKTDTLLTWQVVVEATSPPSITVAFVDAITGETVFQFDDLKTKQERRTFTASQGTDRDAVFDGGGELWFTEDGQVVGIQPDQEGRDADRFARQTLEYFRDRFGYESYDNDGARLNAYVDYRWVYEGREQPNAFWDGKAIWLTEGMAALDVVVHEFTHAVMERTGKLTYVFQPGALNESFSDVFGAFTESWALQEGAWKFGEDVDIGPFRSLSWPEYYGQPSHMESFLDVPESNDNGGIHRNSGIPNMAAYLLTEGGTHPVSGITVQGIGRIKAEQIYFKAMIEYLTPSADFLDARDALVAACSELARSGASGFGISHRDCGQVANAFAAVGVGEIDTDGDSWGDALDNCPLVFNPNQGSVQGACTAELVQGLSSLLVAALAIDHLPGLVIENDAEIVTASGDRWLVGELRNDGGYPIAAPNVRARVLDDQGQTVWPEAIDDAESIYAVRGALGPGQRAAFAIRLPAGVSADRYQLLADPPVPLVSGVDGDTLVIQDAFLIREVDGANGGGSTTIVRGSVRNAGSKPVRLDGLEVAFLTAQGEPAGLGAIEAGRLPQQLEPGEVALFEVTLPEAYAGRIPAAFEARAWSGDRIVATARGMGQAASDLQVISQIVVTSATGRSYLVGEVRNEGSRPVQDVTIDGGAAASGNTLKAVIEPGGWSSFSIPLDESGARIEPGAVTAVGAVLPADSARRRSNGTNLLVVEQQELVMVFSEWPLVEQILYATIRNVGSVSIEDVAAIATLFDADGNVLWTEKRALTASLAPGDVVFLILSLNEVANRAVVIGVEPQGQCPSC